MELQLVNAEPTYANASFREPATHGYIHLAAAVSPPSRPGPVLTRDSDHTELVTELKRIAQEVETLAGVTTATIFEATAFPPLDRLPYIHERSGSIHLARFDVVALIETESPATVSKVQMTPAYGAFVERLQRAAGGAHVMVARNARRLGNVDRTRQGTFIFNHFVADEPAVMFELYDYLAGWYEAETGLDNSLLLVPLDGEQSDYVAINHARWDLSVPRFLWRQLSKQSFRSYVLANLKANHVGAMPVLYRLA